jgi:hypothetical protein
VTRIAPTATARHHHLQINLGCGFLGVLEQFARHDPQTGARLYDFRVRGRKGVATLRSVGEQGRLVSVYLPAKLGEPGACAAISGDQHRLLQALVRETTRQAKRRRRDLAETEVFSGNSVRGFHRKGSLVCPLLDPNGRSVGFNGNGVRKGQGYRLSTPGGWLAKAGYAPDDVPAFLDDLAVLSRHLGLTAVALDRSGGWSDLDQVRALPLTAPGRRALDRLHLRVYACADYLQRWDAFFCWQPPAPAAAPSSGDDAAVTALAATMAAKGISRRRLAGGSVRITPSSASSSTARSVGRRACWSGCAPGWRTSRDQNPRQEQRPTGRTTAARPARPACASPWATVPAAGSLCPSSPAPSSRASSGKSSRSACRPWRK